ncbi:MAG: hypothetical protein ABEH35_05220 [Haloarculaceae archaeon]
MAIELLPAVELLLAAFAGGVLGAAVGGLPAFSLAGVAIVVGEAVTAAGNGPGVTDSAGAGVLDAAGITGVVGLGPALGPHVAFAGGVAAAAYAGRRGDVIDSDFHYHQAKDIATALGTDPRVLAVGGVFGIVGVVLARAMVGVGAPWDPIAMAVVLSALLHRLVFGYPLIGDLHGGLLDMTPFEDDERWHMTGTPEEAGSPGGAPAADGDPRYVVEPWLPHQYEWANVSLLGFAAGLFGGYVALATGSVFFAFGLSVASLLFLALGTESFPVTYHMVYPASLVALGLGDVPAVAAVLVAGVFGLLGGLAGELAQRVLYAHADTHLDPPMVAIVLTTLLISLLTTAGVLQQSTIPAL